MIFGDDSENLFIGLIENISRWNPKKLLNEGKYQESLYNYLKSLQEQGIIKRERTIRREAGESRADLRVSDVAIELKKDINSKSARDRAENQIRLMLKEFNFVIVVLVGKNKKEAVDTFKHHLNDFISGRDMFGGMVNKIKVIEVTKNKSVNKEQNNSGGWGIEIPKIDMPKIDLSGFK